jgi:hypothetical protein
MTGSSADPRQVIQGDVTITHQQPDPSGMQGADADGRDAAVICVVADKYHPSSNSVGVSRDNTIGGLGPMINRRDLQ